MVNNQFEGNDLLPDSGRSMAINQQQVNLREDCHQHRQLLKFKIKDLNKMVHYQLHKLQASRIYQIQCVLPLQINHEECYHLRSVEVIHLAWGLREDYHLCRLWHGHN